MFNEKVYERIKKTGQRDKLNDYFCELEPDGLYMGSVYEAASLIIPHHYVIIDLGCYMAAQVFLFENFRRYIGIDSYDKSDMYERYDYIPPRRFETGNADHYSISIQEACADTFSNIGCSYVIMNAVPEDGSLQKMVLSTFKNVALLYPGKEGIFQGIYADEMRQITDVLSECRCPYTKEYIGKHPELKSEYSAKQLTAEKMIDEVKSAINNFMFLEKSMPILWPESGGLRRQN